MFFSTEVSIPFETLRQVIQAYPDWKLQIPPGLEVFFIYQAQDGDRDYVQFWERLQNLPEETYFDFDIQRMRKERVVVFAPDVPTRAYMNANPAAREGLHVFDKRKPELCNLIVTDNSPLGPVLKYGARLIIEKGKR